ncbi:MAG TPA: dihydrodipicolinate synthase family protein [Actinomycetota bacterium]|nr:dihydrodipicolinate synthase family protein [Actinomycetota bacterium]
MEGTWFVLPTAFDDAGALDLDAQQTLVDRVVAWGVDGLVTMGVTSEAAALTDPERDHVVRAVVDVAARRVPVVVGCSGASVEIVAERASRASALGGAAALVSAPPAARDVDALPRFFERAATVSEVPLVVQDEPAATGTTIPTRVLVRCIDAARADTVKLEDPPTPPKVADVVEARPDVAVFGGLGGLYALDELRRGGRGTMTGFAFPEILAKVRRLVAAGDAAAATVFDSHLPLIAFEAQQRIGLAIRKEVLRRRGALRSAATRLAPELDAGTVRALDDVLRRVGIVPGSERLELG